MQSGPTDSGAARGGAGAESRDPISRNLVRDYLELLRRRWWLPALGAALAAGVALWMQQNYVPLYRAEAVLQRQSETSPLEGLGLGLGRAQPQLAADIALIKTQAVLGAAVDSLDLRLRVGVDPLLQRRLFANVAVASDAPAGTYSLALQQGLLRITDAEGKVVASGPADAELVGAGMRLTLADPTLLFEGPVQLTVLQRSDVLDQLRAVDVIPQEGNGLVRMRYSHADPVAAAAVVNALAFAFREHTTSSARQESTRRKIFLESQLAAVSDSLRAAQELLDEFRVQAGILNPQTEGETLSGLMLRAQEEARDLRSQERALTRLNTTLRSAGAGDDAYRQMSILGDLVPSAPGMWERLRGYQAQRSDLIVGRTEQNPAVMALDSLIAATKLEMRSMAEETLHLIRQRIQSTDARIAELQRQLGGVPERSTAFGRLQQRVAGIQNMHTILSEKYYEAQVAEAVQQGNLQIVDPAVVPAEPEESNQRQRLLLFIAVGLLAGAGLALLIESLDSTVRDADDAQRATGLQVLGLIPALAAKPGNRSSAIIIDNERDPAAEAFRKIRTTLRFMRAEYPKVIAITSASPAEGKSLVAANLAASLAQQGSRVLLIDGDMRRPSQHRHFGLPSEPGLSDFLVGHTRFEESVHPQKVHRLSVLPCGTKTTAPAELLGSKAFAELLRHSRSIFDSVIIDTPPILAVADAGIIASSVDGVIVVLRSQQTSRFELARAVEQLRQIGAPLLGNLLNGVPRNRRYGRYGGYAAYYGYSYDETDYMQNGGGKSSPGKIKRMLTPSG